MTINVVYSYSQVSEGARVLAKEMGIKRLRHNGDSKWQGGLGKTLLNWGSSEVPEQFTKAGTRVINSPMRVGQMANKLHAFKVFISEGVRVPPIAENLQTAQQWLAQGKMVFARTVLTDHSGNGIVMMDPEHPDTHNVRAQLYTQYIPKDSEYRIHVCNGAVFLIQRKGLKTEFQGQPDINWKIRNLANGFIFARQDVNPPQDVLDQAIRAVSAAQLNFGAVDVIYNSKRKEAYVLEINTAPGLVESTIKDYAQALTAF